MTWFAFVLSAVMAALVAGLLIAMPSISRRTLPLGVSVPQRHVEEPVIARSVRRYRIAVAVALVLAVVVGALLAPAAPAAAASVPVFLLVILGGLAYLLARRPIVDAKRAGSWYEDVPVRLTASVTAAEVRGPVRAGWFVAAVLVLLAAVAVGAVLYPGLPDPTPVHWNAAGVVDSSAPKSVWAVFGPVLIGLALTVFLFLVSILARLSPLRADSADGQERSTRRAVIQRSLVSSLLGHIALIVALAIAGLQLIGWLDPAAWLFAVGTGGMIVLLVVAIVVFFVRYRRAVAVLEPVLEPVRDGRPDAPDDDRYWHGGVFYANRDDPAIFVPKRFGIGWTINFASWGGIAIGIALLVVIVGGLLLGLHAGR
ncbi:MAG TPA: DUF5808 domain-containing protein [Lacisediminihabitans sp.]|uniref:DUF1648 domain-containing protein n=1 Tax=Lacisediminihabitans sp. TaxID=2787631 RepID=UPI002EDA51F9